jgi:L-amino acid N-acyltransferase YncA
VYVADLSIVAVEVTVVRVTAAGVSVTVIVTAEGVRVGVAVAAATRGFRASIDAPITSISVLPTKGVVLTS